MIFEQVDPRAEFNVYCGSGGCWIGNYDAAPSCYPLTGEESKACFVKACEEITDFSRGINMTV